MSPATLYLIHYGRAGFVGRFRSALALTRGDRVVVRSPRGDEFGEVLVPMPGGESGEGDVLRAATVQDDARDAEHVARGRELLAAATLAAEDAELPLSFVDVEVTLDGCAILHALAWDACDATALLDGLAARFGLAVRLFDLSRAPAADDRAHAGCGKPGCGTESGGCSTCGTGGGCSSGSCSRGSVKSADELGAQFAELRRRMEAAGLARTPLK
jgi:cell fate regulator YaaT (PSP1 superfamily)